MARPQIQIDPIEVEKLAAMGGNNMEIADFFGCSVDTLERRFAVEMRKGRSKGQIKLRSLQWRAAEQLNSTMLIWLGKQILGQKDISRLEVEHIPDEAFAQEAERRLKLVGST